MSRPNDERPKVSTARGATSATRLARGSSAVHLRALAKLSCFVPLAICATACGSEEPLIVDRYSAVVRTIRFEQVDDGVASGLDLDGRNSDTRDHVSCFKPDFVDPEGRPGIDNQLATLLPLLDLAGEGALQGLIQNAVNEGRLLIILELHTHDDGSMRLTLRRGEDQPLLATDGTLLAGQTLALHADPLLGQTDDVRRDGDFVEAGPVAFRMPVQVFSLLYLLELPQAHFRFRVMPDGTATAGIVAGGADVEQLVGIARQAGMFAQDFEALFGGAIRDAADLARDADGACRQMSVAMGFDAVPAFTFQ